MKRIGLFVLAGVLMSASVMMNIFDELEYGQDDAQKQVVNVFGNGYFYPAYEVVKKARSLPEPVRVEGVRQLIRFAKEYTQSDDFKRQYNQWRKEKLGYGSSAPARKKLSLGNPMKMLEKAVDKKLNKSEDEKKVPADPNVLIKQRLNEFLDMAASVDFDAKVASRMFVNPDYEAKSREWKMCYRAGKAVVAAAREEVQAWLKELE